VDTSLDTDAQLEIGAMSVASIEALTATMSDSQFMRFEAIRGLGVRRAYTEAFVGMEADSDAEAGSELIADLAVDAVLHTEDGAEWPDFIDNV
jgi:hypothetical protein